MADYTVWKYRVYGELFGTALQAGRSRVWFPLVSLEFFIAIYFPAAWWLWSHLSL